MRGVEEKTVRSRGTQVKKEGKEGKEGEREVDERMEEDSVENKEW